MISVIITSYKEERTIGRAIEAILANKLEGCEILVLAPDYKTLKAAERYSKHGNIRIIRDEGKGKPSALNLALKRARGEILIMTDGDVYVGKNSLKPILEKFRDKNIGAVTGRPVSVNDKSTMLGFWSHLLADTANKRRKKALELGKRIVCSGYLYAIRAGIVNEIAPEAMSEDGLISHLIYQAGYKIEYSPESTVYVKYPSTFNDWIIQKKRSAGGYNQIKRWTEKDLRSFIKESSGALDVLKYWITPKEFFYTLVLMLARIYLWLLIFIEVNVRKKKLKEIWKRADTTK